jgi:hypothetical protein
VTSLEADQLRHERQGEGRWQAGGDGDEARWVRRGAAGSVSHAEVS